MQSKAMRYGRGQEKVILIYPGKSDDKWHFTAKVNGKNITNSKEHKSSTPEEAFAKAMIWYKEVTSNA